MSDKSHAGYFFEQFRVGQRFRHATPRTLTDGDRSLYIGLTGSRDPLSSAQTVCTSLGLARQPLEAFLVFNVAFGKTVPDLSLNAIANLGYADVQFLQPVYSGDTLTVASEVIGLRETSNRKSGVVYVQSIASNQLGRPVLSWIRWVLVRKRDESTAVPAAQVPELPKLATLSAGLVSAFGATVSRLAEATGCRAAWGDYEPGERIDHPGGMTVNDSDHSLATRLYQNTAKVHFDGHRMRATAAGKRLVYGGHVISVCRALAYDGLENSLAVLSMNGGSHVAPTYAGDTLYCATQVLERIDLGHPHVAALRLRLIGAKNVDGAEQIEMPSGPLGETPYGPHVVLDLDYTVALPKSLDLNTEAS